jgi:serine/threonine protein kinase
MAEDADLTRRAIPGYELLRPIGRGAMGVAYLARQLSPGRLVVVKFLEGSDLRRRLGPGESLSVARVRQLLRPLVQALECQREHGILHLDLKPENVLMAAGEKREHVLRGGASGGGRPGDFRSARRRGEVESVRYYTCRFRVRREIVPTDASLRSP